MRYKLACLTIAALMCAVQTTAWGGAGNNKSDLTVLPFAYYTPETETAFLVLGIYTKPGQTPSVRTSSYMGFITYTTLNQLMVNFTPELYTAGGYRVSGNIGSMDFPDKFYGVGPDVSEDDEESYSRKAQTAHVSLQYEVARDLFAGIQFDFQDLSLKDLEVGGLLDSGSVTGSQGGVVSGGGFLLTYDGRDDLFMTRRGLYAEVQAMYYDDSFGSDFNYDTFTLDLRQFMEVGGMTLGFQEYLHLSGGEPPFYQLARLGGSNLMRGYFRGQYRDRNMAAVQVESRIPLSRRWGMVVFASAGKVAHDPGDLDAGGVLTAFGAGARFRIAKEEAINLRMDLAWGEDGSSGVYFTIREAF